MKFLFLAIGLILGTLILRGLHTFRDRRRKGLRACHSVITTTISLMRSALIEDGEIRLSGPTAIHVGRYPEKLFMASTAEYELSMTYTPKTKVWWVMKKCLHTPSVSPLEFELPHGHALEEDLKAFAAIIIAHSGKEDTK